MNNENVVHAAQYNALSPFYVDAGMRWYVTNIPKIEINHKARISHVDCFVCLNFIW